MFVGRGYPGTGFVCSQTGRKVPNAQLALSPTPRSLPGVSAPPGPARAQTSAGTGATAVAKTIDVTAARPVAAALDVIEQRYGVPIDYSDPVYASTVDTQLLYSVHGKPLVTPALIPRVWTLLVRYEEVKETPKGIPYLSCETQSLVCNPVSVWPVHGITALIRKVLNRFAAEGGSIFGVRRVDMSHGLGPRWEVYPIKARNALATFVPQTDFLATTLHIPTAKRTAGEMLDLIAQQLTKKWGRRFETFAASFRPDAGSEPVGECGADGVTARQAIVGLLGWSAAIRMFYGPPEDSYMINIATLPYREPPRPPTPKAIPARMAPPRPYYPSTWAGFSRLPKRIHEIQGALAEAGYLHTAPSDTWDANAVKALRRFQTAEGLPVTGRFDPLTAGRLLPFLPEAPARMVPAKPAMDPALAYWLESTPDGRREIAEALTRAGFYHGPVTSSSSNPAAAAALKAFQKANGLPPNGWFTYQTAERLAPYLPNQKD